MNNWNPDAWSMNSLQNAILVVTACQGSLGGCRMYLGDIFGG